MTTPEPWVGGDTPPDVGCNSATSMVLSADIASLTVLKDIVEATPVKDEIMDDSFAELAMDCVRMCHVLKAATEGRDVDGLSGPSSGQLEDLGRVVRHIESAVSERANCVHSSREYHPESTKQCLIMCIRKLVNSS